MPNHTMVGALLNQHLLLIDKLKWNQVNQTHPAMIDLSQCTICRRPVVRLQLTPDGSILFLHVYQAVSQKTGPMEVSI